MTEHTPETGHDQVANQPTGLDRELIESVAETQRVAAHLLADTLSNSLAEERAVRRRALGPAAYDEATNYLRMSSKVDHAFHDVPDIAELRRNLPNQPNNVPAHEMPGAPESFDNLNNVGVWLGEEVSAVMEPYELMRGQLYSHPQRFEDGGQEQITLSRFVPDTVAGVIYEATATGASNNLRELRKSLLAPDAMSGARQLTPGEAADLEAALGRYHARMTEIAALTPEEILAAANSSGPGHGPEAEPA